jgi:hypothetical protein
MLCQQQVESIKRINGMVRVLDGLWDRGIVVALLAQYLFYVFKGLLTQRLFLHERLLVKHEQWPEDRLLAVIALLSLLHHYT